MRLVCPKLGLFCLLLVNLSGCKDSVSVVEGPESAKPLSPEVNSPTVSLPAQTPFSSNGSTLTIRGLCSATHKVLIAGDFVDEVSCENNNYTFEITKTLDQTYHFLISQALAGVESKPISFTWHRKSTVSPPSLSYPLLSPHASEELVLNLRGNCETGSQVELQGDGVGSVTCAASQFAIDLSKFSDGDYNIDLVQTDLAGNTAQISIVWKKHKLLVSPVTPQLVANSQQIFSASGGNENYAVTLSSNNSGATWDPVTLTYTAGTLAGVVDQLTIVDPLGATLVNDITVVASTADHLILPADSGDGQIKAIQQLHDEPLKIQVVDEYGNGVSAFQVFFQLAGGDLIFQSSQLQSTDSLGFAAMSITQGLATVDSRVVVSSALSALPDINNTGQSLAFLNVKATTANTNTFDFVFDLGVNPDNLIVADFNRDSQMDLAVLNRGESSISLLLGDGSGKFISLAKITGLCSNPTAMASGDFNEDQNLDLIFSCSGPDTYSFLAGLGDGNFSVAISTVLTGAESLPNTIAVTDFDGDGSLDFAMTSIGLSTVAIRMGQGDGTFSAPSVIAAGSSPNAIHFGDFDQINGIDLAILNAGNDMVNVFLNDGSGVFTTGTTYSTGVAPAALVVDDFNNDGGADIAVVNNVDSNISILLNDLVGGFNFPITTSVGQGPISVVARELDGDGNLDLIVANNIDGTVSLLFGSGLGTFTVQTLSTLSNPIALGSADTNGDTQPDILVVSNGLRQVQMIPGQPGRVFGWTHALGNGAAKIVSKDFSGDGLMDQVAVASGDNSVKLMIGNGSGLFQTIGTLATSSNPKDVLMKDFDSDGNIDILVVNQSANSFQMLKGLGSNSFDTPVSYGTGNQPTRIVSADFNGDGRADVVVSNSGSNSISFFPGNGDGSFGTRIDRNGGFQPTAIATGDLNDDGLLDVMVTNESNGSIGVYLGLGTGSFSAPVSYPAQAGSNGVVTGYFNADAFLDVATSNNLASSVSVFFGAGDGSLGTAVNYFCGANPSDLRMGDFNGDGQEDLVVANGVGKKLTVLRGSFLGDFSSSDIIGTTGNTFGLDVSDLNGDGTLDITYVDGFTNQAKVLLGL